MTAPSQRELEHSMYIELSQLDTDLLSRNLETTMRNIRELREFLNRMETQMRITRRILAERAGKERL